VDKNDAMAMVRMSDQGRPVFRIYREPPKPKVEVKPVVELVAATPVVMAIEPELEVTTLAEPVTEAISISGATLRQAQDATAMEVKDRPQRRGRRR
jgi:hypothetical protein